MKKYLIALSVGLIALEIFRQACVLPAIDRAAEVWVEQESEKCIVYSPENEQRARNYAEGRILKIICDKHPEFDQRDVYSYGLIRIAEMEVREENPDVVYYTYYIAENQVSEDYDDWRCYNYFYTYNFGEVPLSKITSCGDEAEWLRNNLRGNVYVPDVE